VDDQWDNASGRCDPLRRLGAAASGYIENLFYCGQKIGNQLEQVEFALANPSLRGASIMSGHETSLNQLKHDAAKNRANLTRSVDELKSKVSTTVDDIRERISPDSIKAAAGDYFRSRGEELVDKARENPLQAAAIGLGLAYPVMGVLRAIPAPVLMIGAGLFLMGSKSGKQITQKAADLAGDLVDQAAVGADSMKRTLHDAQDSASQAIASAKTLASEGLDRLAEQGARARAVASDASKQLSETGATVARSASTQSTV
jgi:hypothetical protein